MLINHRGYHRFLTVAGDDQIVLDDAKLCEAEALDGLHGVYTSLPVASAVLDPYRGLWRVEAAFRVTERDLQLRLIDHWKASRIEAHIAIAFMCLTLARGLSFRLKVQQRTATSEARIRAALHKTEEAIARTMRDKKRYATPMPLKTVRENCTKVVNRTYRNEPFAIN